MKKWSFYTARELKPTGWLRDQLLLQARGLNGHLHEVWPDVRDSAWIGGDRDSWERVPYWLDGFIPLAYLLDDADMQETARKYIDAILERQEEDGWICPCAQDKREEYDTWAVQLIAKTLTVYWQCTGENRIIDAVRKAMRNYYDLLKSGAISLFRWGQYRWFEAFIALDELWKQQPEDWIRELAEILATQGTDYEKAIPLWKRPLNKWAWDTHIVNMAMMLKAEAVSYELLGKEYTNKAEKLYEILKKYNGTAVELFTGDECLSGLSPIQGTELCAVVEQMYSLEQLYARTGDPKWAERLEIVSFNALPAALSDDLWTHQYDQMSNQIACCIFPGKSIFRTNGKEAHLFGLEPNYGCCTANFGQGWPKLALSAFMHDGDTVLSAMPLPSELKTEYLHIRLETQYPFRNRLVYYIDAAKPFRFMVRIPPFAENLTVNGKSQEPGLLSFDIIAGTGQVIEISFATTPRFVVRPNGLKSVRCGSLVFSLPIPFTKEIHEYERDGVERKFPYCDYELKPTGAWNYGWCGKLDAAVYHGVSEVPFSSEKPPVTIKAAMRRVSWDFEDGYDTVCAKHPGDEIIGEEEALELYPYGCAKLRMTEMPPITGEP